MSLHREREATLKRVERVLAPANVAASLENSMVPSKGLNFTFCVNLIISLSVPQSSDPVDPPVSVIGSQYMY